MPDENDPHSTRKNFNNVFSRYKHYQRNLCLMFSVWLEITLGKIGSFTSKHPKKIIFFSILISVLFSSGILFSHTESNPISLWVPKNSQGYMEKEQFDSMFGPFFRIETAIVTRRGEEGDNVLLNSALLEVLHLQDRVAELSILNDEGTEISFGDLCYRPAPSLPCVVMTPLDAYYDSSTQTYNASEILNDPDPYFTITLPGKKTPLGNPLVESLVCADLNLIERSASAIMITWLLQNHENQEENIDAALWEREFIKLLQDFNENEATELDWFFTSESSIEDELSREVMADMKIIVCSYIIMIFYVAIMLGKLHPVHSKFLIGFGGVFTIIFSIFVSFGFSGFFQISYSPISIQVLPFLILGIGVDDMFIIVNSYKSVLEREHQNQKEQEKLCFKKLTSHRMKRTMRHCGLSITLTSVCDLVAFLSGSVSKMPVVKSFCFQASIAIIVLYFLQLTMFTSLVVLDSWRSTNNRYDIFPCIVHTPSQSKKGKLGKFLQEGNFLRKFIEKYYTKHVLKKTWPKILIVLLFLTFFGICCYGVFTMERGLGVHDVFPSQSYLIPLYKRRESYFGHLGAPIYVVTPAEDNESINYSSFTTRDELRELENRLKHSDYTRDDVLHSWHTDFFYWANTMHTSEMWVNPEDFTDRRVPENKFYLWLDDFLHDNITSFSPLGPSHQGDIIFDETGAIKATRIFGYYLGLAETEDYVSALEETNNYILAKNDPDLISTHPLQAQSYAYSVWIVFFEEYLIIIKEALVAIISALVGLFIISQIFLIEVRNAIIIVGFLIMFFIEVLGVSHFWGVDLNPLSVVNIVMGIGIAVEFAGHIMYSFISGSATNRNAMVHNALLEMGPNITGGALSTFLGIIVLSFANYPVFRNLFFPMYFSIIVIGYLQGVLLLPIILHYFGTHTIYYEKKRVKMLFFNKSKQLAVDGSQNETDSNDLDKEEETEHFVVTHNPASGLDQPHAIEMKMITTEYSPSGAGLARDNHISELSDSSDSLNPDE